MRGGAGRVRHPDPAPVQRAGPAGGVLFRQGPARSTAPRAADDAVDRHRHQPAPPLRPSGTSERAGDRDEELRQDPAGVGVRCRPPPRPRARRSRTAVAERSVNVTCPSCETVYRVDPAKVPPGGVRARCAVCSNVFPVSPHAAAAAPATPRPAGPAVAATRPAPFALPRPPAPPAPPAPPTPPAPPVPSAPPHPPAAAPAAPPPPAPPAPPAAGGAHCGRNSRAAHDRPAAARESVHGPGPETEGAAAGARLGLGSGRVPSREAPAGVAGRYATAALQGRNREELAGVRRAGRAGGGQEHAVLGRGAQRDPGGGQQGVLRLVRERLTALNFLIVRAALGAPAGGSSRT